VLHPHVVLYPGVSLGDGVEIHAGTIVGSDGFGYATVRGVHHKVPQVGRVEIGADVEIGALTAIDRALLGATSIGAGTKIDNLVLVGHNVVVGERSILCGQRVSPAARGSVPGSSWRGRRGSPGHRGCRRRAGRCQIGSARGSTGADGGRRIPAISIAAWRRQQAILRRLPEIWKRLRAVEKKMGIQDVGDDGDAGNDREA
jgi:UDP-3-O-[3-hydroxymyristoyl] glucosamine N-acyltransferase